MSTSFRILALDLGPRQPGGELDARSARARRILDGDHRLVHAQEVPRLLLGDGVVLEIEPRVRGRPIDVVLELGEKLERLGPIDVDGKRQIDPAAPRPEALDHVRERIAALARRLHQLSRRGAIDDEAELPPLDHALVLAERQHDGRVQVAAGDPVEGAVERGERDISDRLPARAQARHRARRAQRPAVDRADDDQGARERPEDLRARQPGSARPREMFALHRRVLQGFGRRRHWA